MMEKISLVFLGLFIWFMLCFVGIIYVDWITDAFKRWLRFRQLKKAYKEIDTLGSVVDEMKEQIKLTQKQVGEGEQ